LHDVLKRYMSYVEKMRIPYELKLCILALASLSQLENLPTDIFQRMVPILFKCSVNCKDSDLSAEENRGPPLTESQRQLQLAMLDRALKADIIAHCRKASELIMNKIGEATFKRTLRKIPDHILDKFHRARRR